jgi:hypothetical protein
VISALALKLDGQGCDLEVEVVDELQAHVDVGPPRMRQRKPIEQLAAGVAKEV